MKEQKASNNVILAKRIIDRRRDELYGAIKEAQKEFKAGKGKAGKSDDIMAEILS